MFGDKQYSKQPYKYPTPSEIPEGTGCRTFQIPSDPAWFALFMGALYPLTLPDSFQQNEGGLSVETTAEIFQDLIELTYANAENGCVFCTQPGGEPIVRLDEDGYFQQLVDSEWLPPEGEYEIPPTPEREETTDEEKRCAAAANATNVMKVLYETLADDYAEGLTLAEAIAHFIAVAAALIFLPGGLIAAAIALALVLFRIMFETAEFVTADYWTTAFDDKMQCALYRCSSVNGSGVVTFDYECFQNDLARQIDAEGDPFEVVLWGQVQAMLMFLGVDGLNLAGGTTAIPTADCEDCAEPWCYTWLSSDGFDPPWTLDYGDYNGGTDQLDGEHTNPTTGNTCLVQAKINFASSIITFFEVAFEVKSAGTGGGNFYAIGNGTTYASNIFDILTPAATNVETSYVLGGESTPDALTDLWIQLGVPSLNTLATYCHVTRITIKGMDDCPFGEPNCEV